MREVIRRAVKQRDLKMAIVRLWHQQRPWDVNQDITRRESYYQWARSPPMGL